MKNRFDIIMSKTGHPIPLVNDILIHSKYDPIKEANKIIGLQDEKKKISKNVLIIGLGFGYHIDELEKVLSTRYQSDYNITIIEPNEWMVKQAKDICKSLSKENCKILTYPTAKEYYENIDFLEFLVSSPSVISLPSYHNCFSSFIADFLKYEADNTLENIKENITSQEVKAYLEDFHPSTDIKELAGHIAQDDEYQNKLDILPLIYEQFSMSNQDG